MTAWNGQHVTFLTLDDNLQKDIMISLVQKLDRGWETYREIVGTEPKLFKHHDGKPTLAAVPNPSFTCGAGCGYLGTTGIELALFYSRDYANLKKNPEACPHYMFYEMGRNFYVFRESHSYFATGFAVFMRYICMDSSGSFDVEPELRNRIETLEANINHPDLNMSFLEIFTSKGDSKRGIEPHRNLISDQNSMYASVMLHLRKNHGGDEWVKRFYHVLKTAEAFPMTETHAAYRQSLNWLVAASIASGQNLAPLFIERYKFPLNHADRKTLAHIQWEQPDLKVKTVLNRLAPQRNIPDKVE